MSRYLAMDGQLLGIFGAKFLSALLNQQLRQVCFMKLSLLMTPIIGTFA
jgi:hypothetical protein